MSLRKLPTPPTFERPQSYAFDAPAVALEKWTPRAAVEDQAATISIYDVIGQDFWTGEGVTAKRVSAALRSIGQVPVTVNLNSPGGDMFEGLAIYNLLREHQAEVTIKVMGLAASAASIIAMAGDRIEMGLGTFLMVHNSWGMVIGNQQDMRDAAETFAEFDAAMADIYAARTGLSSAEIADLMAEETWLRPAIAIEKGFADATFDAPKHDDKNDNDANTAQSARAKLDATLARAGMPRSERRRLIKEAAGMPSAAATATPCAGYDPDAVQRLIATLQT